MQKRLCRAIPLEMIGTMTVGGLRALAQEGGAGALPYQTEVRVLSVI